MKEVIFTVKIPKEITHDDLARFLCNALEGGSNYWLEEMDLGFQPTQEEINDKEKYGDWNDFPQYWVNHPNYKLNLTYNFGKKAVLDLAKLRKGLQILAEKHADKLADLVEDEKEIIGIMEDADCLLQCSLFGEKIF